MASGDYGCALRTLQDEAELEGLYPPKEIAATNPEGTEAYAPPLTPQERVASLAALYAAAGAELAVEK